MFDRDRTEDASDDPHSITHSPEALRYAVMSRIRPAISEAELPDRNFTFRRKSENQSYVGF